MRVFACYWNAPEVFWRIFYFGRLLQNSQSQEQLAGVPAPHGLIVQRFLLPTGAQ